VRCFDTLEQAVAAIVAAQAGERAKRDEQSVGCGRLLGHRATNKKETGGQGSSDGLALSSSDAIFGIK
jgi:hypothetical protein